MSATSDVGQAIEILLMVLSLAASFWPILVLAPLGGKRRRAVLPAMLAAWVLSALMRGAQTLTRMPSLFTLIPEPFDTIAFWATGALLALLYVALKIRQRRTLLRKAGEVRQPEDLLN